MLDLKENLDKLGVLLMLDDLQPKINPLKNDLEIIKRLTELEKEVERLSKVVESQNFEELNQDFHGYGYPPNVKVTGKIIFLQKRIFTLANTEEILYEFVLKLNCVPDNFTEKYTFTFLENKINEIFGKNTIVNLFTKNVRIYGYSQPEKYKATAVKIDILE